MRRLKTRLLIALALLIAGMVTVPAYRVWVQTSYRFSGYPYAPVGSRLFEDVIAAIVPGLLDELEDALAGVGQPEAVRLVYEPGTRAEYSGGGYGVLQLLIEEVTEMSTRFLLQVRSGSGVSATPIEPDTIALEGRASVMSRLTTGCHGRSAARPALDRSVSLQKTGLG